MRSSALPSSVDAVTQPSGRAVRRLEGGKREAVEASPWSSLRTRFGLAIAGLPLAEPVPDLVTVAELDGLLVTPKRPGVNDPVTMERWGRPDVQGAYYFDALDLHPPAGMARRAAARRHVGLAGSCEGPRCHSPLKSGSSSTSR
jgi:hypothetical protein